MEPDTAGQQPVNIRAGVIESSTRDPGQSHRESTDGLLVTHLDADTGEPVTAVDPDAGPRVDQDVGDLWVGQQRLERPGPENLSGKLATCGTCTGRAKNDSLTVEHLGHETLRGCLALPDLLPDRRRQGAHEALTRRAAR